MSAELATSSPNKPADPVEVRAKNAVFKTALLCGLLAVFGGQALSLLVFQLDGNPDHVQTFLTKLVGASIIAWVIAFIHEVMLSPEGALRSSVSLIMIPSALVIGGLFEVYVMSFEEVISLYTSNQPGNDRVKQALLGSAGGNGQLAFWLLTGVWVLSASVLAIALTNIPFDLKGSRSNQVKRCAAEGLVASLFAMVVSFVLVLAIRIVHSFVLMVAYRNVWRTWVADFYGERPESGIGALLIWFPGQVVLWIDGLWGDAWWGPLLTIGILVIALVKLASVIDESMPALVVFLSLLFVFGSLIFLIITPVFTWSLLSIPFTIWLSFVVPGVTLGALLPFLRDPSEKRGVWATLALVVGIFLAAVTWGRIEQDWIWWVMIASVAGLALAMQLQLRERSWWPLFAVFVALLVGTLNGMFQATFSGVRDRLAQAVLPTPEGPTKQVDPSEKLPPLTPQQYIQIRPLLRGDDWPLKLPDSQRGLGDALGGAPDADSPSGLLAPPQKKSNPLLDDLRLPLPGGDSEKGLERLLPKSTEGGARVGRDSLADALAAAADEWNDGPAATPIQRDATQPVIHLHPSLLADRPATITIERESATEELAAQRGPPNLGPASETPASGPPATVDANESTGGGNPNSATLEICLAASLGFWITIALLASWSMAEAHLRYVAESVEIGETGH